MSENERQDTQENSGERGCVLLADVNEVAMSYGRYEWECAGTAMMMTRVKKSSDIFPRAQRESADFAMFSISTFMMYNFL